MLRSIVAATVLFSAGSAFAYQVTGEVKEVTDNSITVMKGKEKFEMATNADTKGDKPKVGDKVTVEYSITATNIEMKPAKGAKKGGDADKTEKTEKTDKGAATPAPAK
jgi:hypothetical protein